MTDVIKTEPLVTLDYAAVCHPDTFIALEEVTPGTMLAIAVRIGHIRLIDNIVWLGDDRWLL